MQKRKQPRLLGGAVTTETLTYCGLSLHFVAGAATGVSRVMRTHASFSRDFTLCSNQVVIMSISGTVHFLMKSLLIRTAVFPSSSLDDGYRGLSGSR